MIGKVAEEGGEALIAGKKEECKRKTGDRDAKIWKPVVTTKLK